ncbi:MAG: hypothetical protein ACR2F6_15525 [Mycobacteriales bacterium]
MSDTQIWIFGILAFIVVITLVTRLTRKRGGDIPWWAQSGGSDTTKAVRDLADNQAAIKDQLAHLIDKSSSLDQRLDRIEHILKDVA